MKIVGMQMCFAKKNISRIFWSIFETKFEGNCTNKYRLLMTMTKLEMEQVYALAQKPEPGWYSI